MTHILLPNPFLLLSLCRLLPHCLKKKKDVSFSCSWACSTNHVRSNECSENHGWHHVTALKNIFHLLIATLSRWGKKKKGKIFFIYFFFYKKKKGVNWSYTCSSISWVTHLGSWANQKFPHNMAFVLFKNGTLDSRQRERGERRKKLMKMSKGQSV